MRLIAFLRTIVELYRTTDPSCHQERCLVFYCAVHQLVALVLSRKAAPAALFIKHKGVRFTCELRTVLATYSIDRPAHAVLCDVTQYTIAYVFLINK
jgi:hypothetical protein